MKKHLIIIEDNRELRETMQIIFESAGYRVTAMGAINTVEELIDLCADCFIIDEQLPVITGHIICIILNSKPQTKHIPVILMSASDELEGYASLCEAKAFLKKPFDPAHLLELVAGVVEDSSRQLQ